MMTPRLQKICDLVPPCEAMADVGTDHGFVPASLLETKKAKRVIATDVSGPSLEKCRPHQRHYGEESFAMRLGDGLLPLGPGEVDGVVIAGMGGDTILEILGRGREVVDSLSWMILQPMQQRQTMCQGLRDLGWRVARHELVKDRKKFYHIYRVEREGEELTEDLYPRTLLESEDDLVDEYLSSQEAHWEALLALLERAKGDVHERKREIEEKRRACEEAKAWRRRHK